MTSVEDFSTHQKSATMVDIFLPIFRKLWQMEESVPFKTITEADSLVVDASALPTDLSDVEKRLTLNLYEEPWKFIRDVWIIFENTWLYNKKSSKVYSYCSKIADIFEREVNEIMRSLGYCCGRWYTFDPPTLKCKGKEICSILKNEKYYSYNDEFNFCPDCFKSTTSPVRTDNNETIGKEQFIEMKNDSFQLEPFAVCNKCGRKLHQICVLYLKSLEKEEFICNTCDQYSNNRREKLREKYSAKHLPVTKLSQHIQDRVDIFLKSRNLAVGCVTVRVVAASKKYTHVKDELRKSFVLSGKFPEKFPYTAKTLFVFYDIDGTDVAIFAMHVQEYDSACPEPNNRRVYISYIDSVNFFQPKESRTDLYFEILLGYMDYTKILGFKAVHVWACPPPDGEDYLFFRHPESQKSPNHDRLEQWYNELFKKGMERGVIVNNLKIYNNDQSLNSYLSSIGTIPYFENDFWPNVLEDNLKNLKGTSSTVSDPDIIDQNLAEILRSVYEESKEVFFVFQLFSYDEIPQLQQIVDPDSLLQCSFMDDRDNLLIMCQEKNYEFSTVRRAKFSTLVLLYELHSHEYEKSSTYSCNLCMKRIIGGYHCKICDDFDLCARCWRESKHEHDMEYLITNSSDLSTDPVEPVKTMPPIQNKTEKLIHARLCKDRSCNNSGCSQIKRLFSHFTVCSTKMKSSCALCKELLAMCWHHAKFCKIKNCVVPTCERIKEKLTKK